MTPRPTPASSASEPCGRCSTCITYAQAGDHDCLCHKKSRPAPSSSSGEHATTCRSHDAGGGGFCTCHVGALARRPAPSSSVEPRYFHNSYHGIFTVDKELGVEEDNWVVQVASVVDFDRPDHGGDALFGPKALAFRDHLVALLNSEIPRSTAAQPSASADPIERLVETRLLRMAHNREMWIGDDDYLREAADLITSLREQRDEALKQYLRSAKAHVRCRKALADCRGDQHTCQYVEENLDLRARLLATEEVVKEYRDRHDNAMTSFDGTTGVCDCDSCIHARALDSRPSSGTAAEGKKQ